MADKKQGFLNLVVTVFILAAALTSAQENVRRSMPPASMIPPAPFPSPSPQTTTHATMTTTTTTTTSPTPQNTTTANMTAAPVIHKTTTAKTTTTTPATHNTTTPVPHNTTTPVPHNTTTPVPHNTTTPVPHNTTTAKTTVPTPAPTPAANATEGTYIVKDKGNVCVMVKAAIQIHVNNSKAVGTYIVQPNNTEAKGQCLATNAGLQIVLKEGFISMNFTKNDTTHMVYVSDLAVSLTYSFKFGEAYKLNRENKSLQLFSMAVSHSYTCKSESVFMGEGIYLEFKPNNMQAFNFTNNQFGPLDRCKADQPNYSVAIGVGVVLLLLIIIVVVVYLISRKKRTDGYQSF
ncbi:macrosialin [Trichomycterus rosablanca]|uniref:macrosialin n=1 Tax=Trichomycterus rosablanca TaxID=2290929 RepID=UPI002F355C0F